MTILDTQNMTPDTAAAIKKALAGEEILISEGGKLYAKMKVVEVHQQRKPKKKRNLVGSMPDLVAYMSDDFNEPLDDFKEYMPD